MGSGIFLGEIQESTKPHRGCMFGCLCAALMAIAALALLVAAVILGSGRLRDRFTDTTPLELPSIEYGDEELKTLQDRVQAFREGVDEREPTEPLVLSERDVNLLIQGDPRWEKHKGKLFVSIKGDELRATISMPLDELDFAPLKGRYLNGAATISLSTRDGVLDARMDSLTIKGQPCPEQFMAEFRSKNLAEDIQRDEDARRTILGLERVEVKDGAIVVVPKVRP